MYGRNSYLGEGICTHGNDAKKCGECAFARDYKLVAVKRSETNIPVPLGCGPELTTHLEAPLVGRVDITYFCTSCQKQETVSVRWRSHHALPKGWRCRDIIPTNELPRRTDHIFSCSLACRKALDLVYPPPKTPKWFSTS